MKTRNLLLLALACGLAIMLAGAVFFFQLTTQDDASRPVPIGRATRVGDMTVTVIDVEETGGILSVAIAIGGTVDDDPADEFRLIASARPIPLASSNCEPSGDDEQGCSITFDVSGLDGASRVLFYDRGEEQARWVLA